MTKGHKRNSRAAVGQQPKFARRLNDLEVRFEPVADHVAAHEHLLHDHDTRITRLERSANRRSRSRRA